MFMKRVFPLDHSWDQSHSLSLSSFSSLSFLSLSLLIHFFPTFHSLFKVDISDCLKERERERERERIRRRRGSHLLEPITRRLDLASVSSPSSLSLSPVSPSLFSLSLREIVIQRRLLCSLIQCDSCCAIEVNTQVQVESRMFWREEETVQVCSSSPPPSLPCPTLSRFLRFTGHVESAPLLRRS